MPRVNRPLIITAALLAASPVLAQDITLYSGRGESFVAPLIEKFQEETGINVAVRYGGTAELAVLLQEEGDASPADVFWAQDPGALGAVGGLFAPLPDELLDLVPETAHDSQSRWLGTSGRARLFVYSTERATEDEFPASILDLTDEQYQGRVSWAPTNGSFQAHVTALRAVLGEEETKTWLEGMIANDTQLYSNNGSQIQAVADGEVDFALVNHYYLRRNLTADPQFPASQAFFEDGDIGNLMMVTGVGILESSDEKEAAQQLIEFLLTPESQTYFAQDNQEYALIEGADNSGTQPTLEEALEAAPDVDLNAIDDLEGTLELLREVGLL